MTAMFAYYRQRRAVFLLAILICLVAVNVHAAAHLGAGSVECEFCSNQYDSSDVIVATEVTGLVLPVPPKPFERRIQHARALLYLAAQQRGPPPSFS